MKWSFKIQGNNSLFLEKIKNNFHVLCTIYHNVLLLKLSKTLTHFIWIHTCLSQDCKKIRTDRIKHLTRIFKRWSKFNWKHFFGSKLANASLFHKYSVMDVRKLENKRRFENKIIANKSLYLLCLKQSYSTNLGDNLFK